MTHVMIDIETLGTGNDAVILSIGACKFTDLDIIDSFHVGIFPESCQQYGLTIDASTVMWWMQPDRDEARKQLLALNKVDLYEALSGFVDWYGDVSLPTYGNGASFDNVLLRNAFKVANIQCPWKFWDDRCYRTMKNLNPAITHPRKGTHHDAHDDAIYQAEHLIKIWRELGGY